MAVNIITDNDFKDAIQHGIQITDFWADWCPPCRMQSPIIQKLSETTQGVVFNQIDVDTNPTTASQLNIEAIPTLLITRDGQAIDRLVGLQSYQKLSDYVHQLT